MKVFFHDDFYTEYTSDPAAAIGRMESIVEEIKNHVEFLDIEPAKKSDIVSVHTLEHVSHVERKGLYYISALAAGGAIQAAFLGLREPCFALIRPPGHHASADSSWGFCYFNNMAIAISALKRAQKINKGLILDFDLHFGDGTVNILGEDNSIEIYNTDAISHDIYMEHLTKKLEKCEVDIIGVSAGFDNHVEDWGGLLTTKDYHDIGLLIRNAAIRCKGGCFGILEGGYNHTVLGHNVLAFLKGLSGE